MRRIALFVDEELLAGLKALKAEHDAGEAESIRRAIAADPAAKGVLSRRRVSRRATANRSARKSGTPAC